MLSLSQINKIFKKKIVESLYCTPETIVTLYVNCTRIKIKNLKKIDA